MPLYALLALESGAVAAPSGASASSGEFLSGAGAERERAAALPAEPAQTSFFLAEAVKAQSPCTDGARFAAGAGPRCALGGGAPEVSQWERRKAAPRQREASQSSENLKAA